MKEVTFALDDGALRDLDRAVARLDISKSQVVREALELYAEHLRRRSAGNREHTLATSDRSVIPLPVRVQEALDAELEEVRSVWSTATH
jgi:hypothetical protein